MMISALESKRRKSVERLREKKATQFRDRLTLRREGKKASKT